LTGLKDFFSSKKKSPDPPPPPPVPCAEGLEQAPDILKNIKLGQRVFLNQLADFESPVMQAALDESEPVIDCPTEPVKQMKGAACLRLLNKAQGEYFSWGEIQEKIEKGYSFCRYMTESNYGDVVDPSDCEKRILTLSIRASMQNPFGSSNYGWAWGLCCPGSGKDSCKLKAYEANALVAAGKAVAATKAQVLAPPPPPPPPPRPPPSEAAGKADVSRATVSSTGKVNVKASTAPPPPRPKAT